MSKKTEHHRGESCDGRIFWGYRKDCANGEYWIPVETYIKWMAKSRDRKPPTPESRARNAKAVADYRLRKKLEADRALKRSQYPRLPKTINLWALENDPDFDLYQPPKQKPVLSDG